MPVAFISRTIDAPTSLSNASLAADAVAHVTGNALFVIIHGNTASFGAAVTDTALNAYTNVATGTDGTGFYAIYRAHDITGNAANVVDAQLTVAQTYAVMVVYECSGFGTNTPEAATGFGSGISDGGANAVFSDLSFTGSDAFYMALGIAGYEAGTTGIHVGATATAFGTDGPDAFQYFKDVRHAVTSSPHQCGVNLNTGISIDYRWGAVVFAPGQDAPPVGTVLMGQGAM